MTSLNDIISHLKFELGKEGPLSKESILPLVEKIEPLAARDWARIKKLERKVEAFSGKSPEELETSMKELETLKAELESTRKLLGEKDELLKTISKERAEKEAALAKSLSEEKAAVARLLLDAGLTAELSKANVKPSLLGAAKALIREKGILSVDGEGEVRTAVARVRRDGVEQTMSLSDWVREFVASDEGKEFIAAKENAGSGAGEHRASTGTASTHSLSAERFWSLPAKDRSAFILKGGTVTED
jgi:anion-transporting  ArsA/GET3 family ATPase